MSFELETMARTIQEFQRAFALAERDGEVVELPGVVASVCPAIGFRSFFNAAAYLPGADIAAAMPRLRERWTAREVNACAVWVHESDARTAVLLAEDGFEKDSSPAAMAAEIAALPPPEGNVEVERVSDLEEFDAVLADAWEFPPGVMVYAFPGLLDRFRCYVARDAAGRSLSVLGTVEVNGDVGFTLVSTRVEARGRGAASEAMRVAIADAAGRGCTTTTLQATAIGRPVYERLGYETFGTYDLWEHRTPAPWES